MRATYVIPLLLLLVFSGCVDILFNKTGDKGTNVDCNSFTDVASKDSCYTDQAARDKTVVACASVSSANHDSCVRKVADARNEGQTCFAMTSFDNQIPCVDAHAQFLAAQDACNAFSGTENEVCNRHAARVRKNEVFCYQAGSQKNACFIDVAKATNNADLCDLIDSSDGRESCYVATAVNAKNSGACLKIASQDARESCLSGVAEAQGNAAVCDSIETLSIKAACLAHVQSAASDSGTCGPITNVQSRDSCFLSMATDTGRVDVCMKVITPSVRNDCYLALGQSIHDPAICDSIVSDDAKEQACRTSIANAAGSVASCNILQPPAKDACISDIALRNRDVSLCSTLTTTTNETNYKDQCFARVADAKGDPNICLAISVLAAKDACLSAVGVSTKNPATCPFIADITLQESCYHSIASALQESAVCSGIQDREAQDACVKDVATASNNSATCEAITDTLVQDQCYSAVGIAAKDKAACEKIVNRSIKDPCIVSVAEALNDWHYCLNVSSSNPVIEQACLAYVADKIGSVEPCTHIPAQQEKGLCYGKVGITTGNFTICDTVPLKAVPYPSDAHFARDTCWNYMAGAGASTTLCTHIYDVNILAACQG